MAGTRSERAVGSCEELPTNLGLRGTSLALPGRFVLGVAAYLVLELLLYAATGGPDAWSTVYRCAAVALVISLTSREWFDFRRRTLEPRPHGLSSQQVALDRHALVSEADAQGRITYVNEEFCAVSGYRTDELLGRNHSILNSGHHPREFWRDMYATVARDGWWRGAVCNRAKDGSLYWVQSTIVGERDAIGRIARYVSVRTDVTPIKRIEEALRVARDEAAAADRAKSEFLANISHEIRTPMTAILGYADLLRDELPAVEQRSIEAITSIRRHGEHLLAILNDILDVSKLEMGRLELAPTEVKPRAVLDEIASRFAVEAREKGLELVIGAEPDVPERVLCDPLRLVQILSSLVGNAIKFTQVGRAELLATWEQGDGNARLRFTVRDTGIGIEPERLPKLFAPFSQGDSSMARRYGGAGLGLRISRRLAELMGGGIAVQSSPGIGSTFVVEISAPLVAAREARFGVEPRATGVIGTPDERQPLAGRRILIVEDGPDNQRLIAYTLRKAGADVIVVENGRLGVEQLTDDGSIGGGLRQPSPVDLVLMDMQMPEMDGYTATTLLREKGCRLPIVALTAHALTHERGKCIAAGCTDYATKPIDRRELVALCARLLDVGNHSAAEAAGAEAI